MLLAEEIGAVLDDDFLKAMADVRPLQVDKRITLQKSVLSKATIRARSSARRESAQAENSAIVDPLSNAEVSQVEPNAILAFRRPGIQHGVYKQLRLGRYTADVHLDLHNLNVNQARRAVYQFIQDALANDIRCVLIAHGKGEGRKKPAVLKSYLAHWLTQMDEVLAFHSAQKHHGGAGACYILLKKRRR